jgi:hypothetical protein
MTKIVPKPVHWLTRDSFEGQLEPFVDVWDQEPVRHVHNGEDGESLGVSWFDQAGGIGRRVARPSAAKARKDYRTLPEDDRQCVRIG